MESQIKQISYYKYPRTFHLPYSPKRGSDDKVLIDDSDFEGKYIVVLEKMDGENTTIYTNHLHARSIDSVKDESHRWLERFQNFIIPQLNQFHNWRICGENMFYKHTVSYQDLESVFLGYSIWIENQENQNQESNYSLSWHATKAILEKFEEYRNQKNRQVEGFVIRLESSFLYQDFSKSVAKYVCDDFEITTNKHWRYEAKTLNQLRNNQNIWTKIV